MNILNGKLCILLLSMALSVSALGAEVGLSYDSTLSSANQGVAEAQFNLGWMYAQGQGVRQDYHKAFEWYTKAANQGNAAAQYNLGVMYGAGQGVQQSSLKAKEWFGLSCDNGNQKGCDIYKIYNGVDLY